MKIAIIGGGLAGTACAYMLKQAGHEPIIYEAGPELAFKASGNPLGLYNPRFTAEYDAIGQYYASAFNSALQTFQQIPDINWNACGALHFINDEKKQRRFAKMIENWRWPEDAMRIVSKEDASKLAGVEIDMECLFLSQAGYVSPDKLCHVFAGGVDAQLNTKIENLKDIDADAIIIASGQGVKHFEETAFLPIKAVRGQITRVKATHHSAQMQCNIQYGGYISPPTKEGWHMLGSTFQRWLDHEELMEEDNADNLAKLGENVPHLVAGLEVLDARASLRTSVPDHFPVAGHLQDHIYISTAHGSHGLVSAIESAKLITKLIEQQTPELAQNTIDALSPLRYHSSA